MLEHQAFEKGLSLQIKPKQTAEFYEQESITPPQQVRTAGLQCRTRTPTHAHTHTHTQNPRLQSSAVVCPKHSETTVHFQEILDSLAELYSLLQEEDMWAGLWQKRCRYAETATATAYEQHGFFEQVSSTG
jgi:transformation/transcription domain-associated protein